MANSLKIRHNGTTERLFKTLTEKYRITIGIHAEEGGADKSVIPAKTERERAEVGEGKAQPTLIEVASWHEFGIGNPRRSFVADWFDQEQDSNQSVIRAIVLAGIKERRSLATGIQRFSFYAVGKMQARIVAGIAPELTKETKRRKKRLSGQAKDTPLILTGQLKSAIRGRGVRV